MVEDKPTVCISFEPRDEAAALRVAAALREAGIEVVLSSEGGAAAVDGCDLFLPIVSDNTQTQAAGRFRNEWQRAAQRAEAMADDTTFLLPVVVDNTANREARVPPIFRGRPWLRFEVWGSTSPLVARVEAMLERRTAAQAAAQAEQQAQAEALARSVVRAWIKRLPPWVRRLRVVWILTVVVTAGGAVVYQVRRSPATATVSESTADLAVPVVPVERLPGKPRSPAASAGTAPSSNAVPVAAASSGREAAADATSAYSIYHDTNSTRALGAVGSAPPPPVAGGRASDWLPQPPVMRASQMARRLPDDVAEELWADSAPGAPMVVGAVASSGAPGPETLPDNPPAAVVREVLTALWSGQPAVARAELDSTVEGWIESEEFTGPTALLLGLCWAAEAGDKGLEGTAGRSRAEVLWLRALDEVLARRKAQPDDPRLALVEAQVRVLLGQEVGALAALQEFDDSVIGRKLGPQREHLIVWATLGDYAAVMNEVVARFREGKERWTGVRDWLRYDRRFAAWREAMAARERGRERAGGGAQ